MHITCSFISFLPSLPPPSTCFYRSKLWHKVCRIWGWIQTSGEGEELTLLSIIFGQIFFIDLPCVPPVVRPIWRLAGVRYTLHLHARCTASSNMDHCPLVIFIVFIHSLSFFWSYFYKFFVFINHYSDADQ